MVDKVLAYEALTPDAPWNKRAILVADDEEAFEDVVDRAAGYLPPPTSCSALLGK